jgi:hypothetical protein
MRVRVCTNKEVQAFFIFIFLLPLSIWLLKVSSKKCVQFRKMQLQQTFKYDHGHKLFTYQPFQSTT